jgi:acyl-CoA synthetase (AMP-forming)/AMP-acid ligase II
VTPADLLAAALRRDPSRPLVTWYDDATGERVELSVATAANWAAKTANLLAEDDVEAVRLDPGWHWLAVVVALGAWTAGVPVADEGEPLPGDPKEFIARVLPQPDALVVAPPPPDDLGLSMEGRTWTLEALGAAAVEAAAHHRLEPGARVMSTLPLDTVAGIDAGLLVPLAVGGSVVLVAHADASKLAKRESDERVSQRLPR